MPETSQILKVLQHDMHKIRIPGAPSHKEALKDSIAQQSDGLAAWMARNFLRKPFDDTIYRQSLIFHDQNFKNPRSLVQQHRFEVAQLFKNSDSLQLHSDILSSKLLNIYSEARNYPYTSLKYHILLSVALYYNFQKGFKLKDLYLCENIPVDSPFQLIYKDNIREWAILPDRKEEGMSKINPLFYLTWERRRKQSLGGDHQLVDELLSTIGSWTVALATIEDYFMFLHP